MSPKPHPVLMTLRVMWFAFVSNHPIFVFIVFFVASTNTDHPGPDENFNVMLTALSAVSVVMVILSLTARGFMMSRLSESASVQQVASAYQTGSILSWAFAEVVTINGFVLAFISMSPRTILPFAVVGMVCNVLAFPRARDLASIDDAPPKDEPEGNAW